MFSGRSLNQFSSRSVFNATVTCSFLLDISSGGAVVEISGKIIVANAVVSDDVRGHVISSLVVVVRCC